MRYLAGSPVSIPILPPNNASNASTWSNDVSGLACIYGDRSFTNGGNFTFYGLLYNYYAVVNPLNLCPNGWHVPSVEEWGKLIDSSGGINFAGKNLKGQSYSPSALRFSDEWFTKGNPIGNFSASPGGFRKGSDGSFGGINLEGTFWTSTNSNDTEALSISIKDNDAIIRKDIISDKKNGHSVRCVWNGDPL